MPHLTPHDVMTMFMALAVLLGCAKLAAELMQKIGQPSILGEISVGIFLGPTVLGRFRPHVYEALFPTTGPMPIVLDTVTTLGGGFLFADGRFGDRSAQHLPARQEHPAGESFRGGIPLRSRLPGGQHFPQYLGAQEGANPLIFALLALREMCEVAAEAVRNAPERLFRLVSETGADCPERLGNELAVPYARVNGLTRPLVIAAKSTGIDFDARDGKPARLIIMILTGDS